MKAWQIAAATGAGIVVLGLTVWWAHPVVSVKLLPPRPAIAATVDDGAKAFLQGLYAHYDGHDMDFSPLNENAPQWFDPEMVALMQEDARLSGGDITVIDADPICQCQDYVHITADIVVTQDGPDHATAKVRAAETGFKGEGSDQTFDLRRINGQWRIHDISNSYRPSLRQAYIDSNTELKKGG